MKTKTQFLLITLKERNGEFEYSHKLVREIPKEITYTWGFAEKLASQHYEDRSEHEDGIHSFYGGSIAVSVKSVETLTEEEFKTLRKYL